MSRLAALLVIAGSAFAQRAPVIDNEYVRVLDVTESSTTRGRPHEHSANRVMIYLTAGKQKIEYSDGRVNTLEFQPGTAMWSPAGGMHTSQNIGGSPFRVIEVELKKQGGKMSFPALDPVRVDPKRYEVLLDQPQARVIRARAAARASIPLHEHTPNRVIVFVTEMHARATDESGKTSDIEAKAGEVRWAGAAKHREQNLSDQPFEVVVVELK